MKKILLLALFVALTGSQAFAGNTEVNNIAKGGGISYQAATAIDQAYSTAVTSSEIPSADNSIDLGSTAKQFRDEYIGRKIFLNSIETVAAGTSAQGDGPLTATKVIHLVTGFDETKVVTLPACAAADVGVVHFILNSVTNKFAKVFPASGSQINSLGANAAYTQGVTGQGGKVLLCACQAATQWYCA